MKVYGSRANNLALPTSDLDIAVCNIPYQTSLQVLYIALSHEFDKCHLIEHTKVPVIKLMTRAGLKVDITVPPASAALDDSI